MASAWALPSGGFDLRFLRQLQPLLNGAKVFPDMAKIWQIASSGCEWSFRNRIVTAGQYTDKLASRQKSLNGQTRVTVSLSSRY
jgi:hypothetical protein